MTNSSLLSKANRLMEAKHYNEAILEYNRINHKNPLYVHAQANIARALRLVETEHKSKLQANLLAAVTSPKSGTQSWSAIITLWKRSGYLDEQITSIKSQTIPPEEIFIIQNEAHLQFDASMFGNNPPIHVITSSLNSLYTRFILGYLSCSEYICVFDDDVIPGEEWIQNCFCCSHKHNALVGPSGRVAAINNEPAWTSIESYESVKDELCDWVCNSYFFKRDWIQYLHMNERPEKAHMTYDDIHFAASLRAFGGITAAVPAQDLEKPRTLGHQKRSYGHDSHALWKRQNLEHRDKRSAFIRKVFNNPS